MLCERGVTWTKRIKKKHESKEKSEKRKQHKEVESQMRVRGELERWSKASVKGGEKVGRFVVREMHPLRRLL